MNYKEIVLKKLSCENLISKILRTKTLIFAYDTSEDEKNYNFAVYHPLEHKIIEELASSFEFFPEEYKEFLSECNGLFLYGGNFYMYGKAFLEKGMTWEEQIYQPYDLVEENEDPPFKVNPNYFYFGGTPNSIFVYERNGVIMEISRKSKKQINIFSDLKTLILNFTE